MNSSGSSSPLRRATLIATRLCLILSLWQAPIPWIHCHGTDLNEVKSSLTALQQFSTHLAVFHSAIDVAAEYDLGWHFHWVLPCWGHALDDTPDDEPPSQEVFAFDQATVSPTHSIDDVTQAVTTLKSCPLRILRVAARSEQRPTHLVDPLSSREFFSVLRC